MLSQRRIQCENLSQRFDWGDKPNFCPDEQLQKKRKENHMTPGHQKIRNFVV